MPTNEVETPQREMPRYQSHKQVHALKLQQVVPDSLVGHTRFVPAESGYRSIVYQDSAEVVKRCKAAEMGDPGYIVVYPDGFTSWSPTEAFEAGYTRI